MRRIENKSTHPFVPGDRVRVSYEKSTTNLLSGTYTVMRFNPRIHPRPVDGEPEDYVHVEGVNGGWFPWRFEKI